MALSKETNQTCIKDFGKTEKDTGSIQVQVAILTKRIEQLSQHVKGHAKDAQANRGLLVLVGKRKKLLQYLLETDRDAYIELIAKLGLRK
jgi:small subunit ribosomal protein S15